jgi:tol-pal system protein YbgF
LTALTAVHLVMSFMKLRPLSALLIAAPLLMFVGAAVAQDARPSSGLFDNMFNRGEQPAQRKDVAQADSADMAVRLDRMENALRQLTGTLEQLQYRNQQLETQLKRMQDDTEYRFQQLGSKGAAGAPPRTTQPSAPVNNGPAPATAGRRSDVFDPSQQPNAPGAPRTLGNEAVVAPPTQNASSEPPPVGAPGGRVAGQPLDLSAAGGDSGNPPPPVTNGVAPQASPLPPPPARNAVSNAGPQLATLPPSATPQDEYDMAYGYVLHKDYALAEQAFRDFIGKYPNERLLPDAQYWLGESMFQRQRYRDAAENFLAVSTKYEKSGKAPDSLLRLGQSLAAMSQKEAACATLAEVARKYPRASASVKRGVTQEQKRAHC